jgi:hypothetical protein
MLGAAADCGMRVEASRRAYDRFRHVAGVRTYERFGDVESSGFGGARAVKTFASAQRLVLGVGRE